MAQKGQKEKRSSEFLQIFTQRDTGTYISLVGQTQHCKSDALTARECVPHCLSKVHEATAMFVSSLCPCDPGVPNTPTAPPATQEHGLNTTRVEHRRSRSSRLYPRLQYLLGAEVGVGLPHFTGPPLDDCIAEHSDDHDEEEVAGVHQVEVDEGTVILVRNMGNFLNVYVLCKCDISCQR